MSTNLSALRWPSCISLPPPALHKSYTVIYLFSRKHTWCSGILRLEHGCYNRRRLAGLIEEAWTPRETETQLRPGCLSHTLHQTQDIARTLTRCNRLILLVKWLSNKILITRNAHSAKGPWSNVSSLDCLCYLQKFKGLPLAEWEWATVRVWDSFHYTDRYQLPVQRGSLRSLQVTLTVCCTGTHSFPKDQLLSGRLPRFAMQSSFRTMAIWHEEHPTTAHWIWIYLGASANMWDRESLNGGRARCEVAPLPIKCPNPAINAQHLGCHVKHSSACHYCSMGGPA